MTERYCPLCNRQTLIRTEWIVPFVVLLCWACGFVHRISEAER